MTSLQSLVLGIAVDSAHEDRQALRERRAERPEVPAGAGTRPGQGPRNLQGPSCSGVAGGTALPTQWLLRSSSEDAASSDHTFCVCCSGKPKFICQIQDTTLAFPGFSFCLSLIASGRALLKGKSCVLTGQGPQPGGRNSSHSRAAQRVSGSASLPKWPSCLPWMCKCERRAHLPHRMAWGRAQVTAGGACCQPAIHLASPRLSLDGAPGLRAGAGTGLRHGVGRGAA